MTGAEQNLVSNEVILNEIKKNNEETAAIKDSINKLSNFMEKMCEGMESLKSRCNALEKQNASLNEELKFLKRFQRKNNCIIGNISETENENLIEKTVSVCQEIGISISEQTINNCYRLGKQRRSYPRPVLLSFNSYLVKKELMNRRDKFKAKCYSIKHDRSPEEREEGKRIYLAMCKLKVVDPNAFYRNKRFTFKGSHYGIEEIEVMLNSEKIDENISKRKRNEEDNTNQINIHPFFRSRTTSNASSKSTNA